MFSTLLTDIVTGLGQVVPAFFKALLDGFVALFVVTGEGGVMTISPVGGVAVVFIVIGICYKIMPTVVGWLRLKMSARRARKTAKAK